MISYSLVANTSAPMDLIDRQTLLEKKLEEFWSSPYEIDQLDEYCSLVCEGDLLLEFSLKDFIMDNLSNVLQAAIGIALEAGGGIAGVFSAGAGAGAGVAGELLNDLIFFGYGVVDFVVSAKGIFNQLAELKDVIVEIFSSTIEDEPQDIYDLVQEAISGAGDIIEDLGFDFDEMMEKLTKAFRNLLTKIAKPAGDMIACFSPIPGTDMFVQNAITLLGADIFKKFIEYYEKIPEAIREVIHGAGKLKDFVVEAVETTIMWIERFATGKYDDQKSALEKTLNNIALGPFFKVLKFDFATEKLIKFLKGKALSAAQSGVELIEKIYPILVSGLSALTVITSEDY